MTNLKREELAQQKEAFENLYNRYLLEILPLAKTATEIKNVEATMQHIDAELTKLEKELTIEIETVSEVEEVTTKAIETVKHYVPVINAIVRVEGSVIELYGKDAFDWDIRIARFNVDGNNGHWVDLDGNCHHVKGFKTILNNLWKIDDNAYLPCESIVKKVRKQWKQEQVA